MGTARGCTEERPLLERNMKTACNTAQGRPGTCACTHMRAAHVSAESGTRHAHAPQAHELGGKGAVVLGGRPALPDGAPHLADECL